jgi:hypothetical protein
MSITRQATTSFSSSVSEIEGDGTLAQTVETSETSFYLGSQSSTSSAATTLAVEVDATSIGTDTLSVVTAEAIVSADTSSVTVDAYAIAESEDGLAFSTAVILVDFEVDADFYFSIGQTRTSLTIDASGSVSISEASVEIIALNLGGAESSDASVSSGEISESPAPADTDPVVAGTSDPAQCGCGDDAPGYEIDVDGNLAIFDISASGSGVDTFVSVTFDAFALEDQFSSVTALIFIATD